MLRPDLLQPWQVTLGAPEFGSAIFGLRAFQGATRSIVVMPAKRGVATDHCNRVAVQLAELAKGIGQRFQVLSYFSTNCESFRLGNPWHIAWPAATRCHTIRETPE